MADPLVGTLKTPFRIKAVNMATTATAVLGDVLGSGSQGVVQELIITDGSIGGPSGSRYVIKSHLGLKYIDELYCEILAHRAISNMFGGDHCNPLFLCLRGVLMKQEPSVTRSFLGDQSSPIVRLGKAELPNIVLLTNHDIGNNFYVIYEKINGKTLYDHLYVKHADGHYTKGTRPLMFREIGLSLLRGLATMHEKHVVHRDLKPENTMIVEDQVKFIDFGSAFLLEAPLYKCRPRIGTPEFMAPELSKSDFPIADYYTKEQSIEDLRKIYKPADVFSMGAMLYDLLYQAKIHGKKNVVQIFLWMSPPEGSPPEPLTLVDPDEDSAPFHDLVLRMLQFNASDRPTAAEALAAWEAASSATSVAGSASSATREVVATGNTSTSRKRRSRRLRRHRRTRVSSRR